MKRALSLLFACLAALWLSAQADTLTLPANLQTIDDEAFYGDTSLDTVTLGDQVTSIGEKAFANSTLRKIDLPESIGHIADNAFDGVDHPEINANKGTYAYDWAVDNSFIDDDITPSPLEDFVIENGVVTQYIGNGGNVVVPRYCADGKSIIGIGYDAFFRCNTVTSVTLPKGLTSIGNRAFWGCRNLTSIAIPQSVSSIGESAFFCCSSLTNITIPKGLTSIGSEAFRECSSLTNITLPEGLTSIGSEAFRECSNLISVTLPEGLTSIGKGAFYGCSSLTNITLPEKLNSIESETFCKCSSLISITLPEGLTSIEKLAFNECSSLTNIVLPEGLTSIGYGAFFRCSSLTSINIPKGVTNIGNSSFYMCSSLTSINIPKGVTNIGNSSFYMCSSLTSITLPEGLTSIEGGAFGKCSSLTSINIPEGVTTIGSGAFTQCSALTSITFPEKCETSIGQEAFYGCNSLTSITFPEKGSGIGYRAFWYCSNLTSIILPEWVTSIGEGAFGNCIKLTSITIPQGVTSISDWSFYNCWSLTDIILPEGVTAIGDWAFAYCGLTSITIPQSVNSIGWRAFYSHSKDLVIYGVKGSYAEAYANANGIQFKEGIAPQQDVHFSITYPSKDNDIVEYKDLEVTWEPFSGAASYILSLRDLTLDELLLFHDTGTITSETAAIIASCYFYAGHDYRVAVAAVPAGVANDDPSVVWSERLFSVSGEEPTEGTDGGIISTHTQYGAVSVEEDGISRPAGLFVEYFQYSDKNDVWKDENKRWEGIATSVDFQWKSASNNMYSYLKTTDFNGKNAGEDVRYLSSNKFAALFTGWLGVNAYGEYDLRLTGDDGVYLKLGKKEPAQPNGWKDGASNVVEYKNITLDPRYWYSLEIRYYNNKKDAKLKFEIKLSEESESAYSTTNGFVLTNDFDVNKVRRFHASLSTFDKTSEIEAIERKLHDQSNQSIADWIIEIGMGNIVDPFFSVDEIGGTFLTDSIQIVKNRVLKALTESVFEKVVKRKLTATDTQETIWKTLANKLGITDIVEMKIDPKDGFLNFIKFVSFVKEHYYEQYDKLLSYINPEYDYDWFTREITNGLTGGDDMYWGAETVIKAYDKVQSTYNKWFAKIEQALEYKKRGADERRSYIHLRFLEGDITKAEMEKLKTVLLASTTGSGSVITNLNGNDYETDMRKYPTKYLDCASSADILDWFNQCYGIREEELFYKQLLYDVRAQAAKEFKGLFVW